MVSLRREERAKHSWFISDVTNDGTDDRLSYVHVHIMKFLTVFPSAMNYVGALCIAGLYLVMKIVLVLCVGREEVRYAVPKTFAYAAGVRI
jgi:hypothetical protein